MVIFLRGMNTDLTDTERALVADLFERQRGRGTLAQVRPQADGRCLRPYRAYRLCVALAAEELSFLVRCLQGLQSQGGSGVFEAMHDRLCQMWRSRAGHDTKPAEVIIDAQNT